MTLTEQLNVHLNTGEKAMLAEAARRQNLSVPAYIRNRLFDPPRELSQADQILLQGLASLRPRFEAALKAINANLAEIADLRQQTATPLPPMPGQDALASIADHLGLSPESAV